MVLAVTPQRQPSLWNCGGWELASSSFPQPLEISLALLLALHKTPPAASVPRLFTSDFFSPGCSCSLQCMFRVPFAFPPSLCTWVSLIAVNRGGILCVSLQQKCRAPSLSPGCLLCFSWFLYIVHCYSILEFLPLPAPVCCQMTVLVLCLTFSFLRYTQTWGRG